jgi:hypothetical protein
MDPGTTEGTNANPASSNKTILTRPAKSIIFINGVMAYTDAITSGKSYVTRVKVVVQIVRSD